MADKEIALMAHLMRRAGFGATFEELEGRIPKKNECVTFQNLLFTIEASDKRRITRVKITIINTRADGRN